jgi:hypothetical protein
LTKPIETHTLLVSDRPDPVHLLFGLRVPAPLLAARSPIAVAAITVAGAIDVLIHSLLAASLLGGEPVVVLRRIDAAAVTVQGLTAGLSAESAPHPTDRDRGSASQPLPNC